MKSQLTVFSDCSYIQRKGCAANGLEASLMHEMVPLKLVLHIKLHCISNSIEILELFVNVGFTVHKALTVI